MCLFTNNKTPIIAIEPMRIWKRLIKTDNGFKTPYQDIEVKVGESLKELFPNKEVSKSILFKKYVIDAQGVHGYVTRSTAKFFKDSNEVITEWEIPAGAKYWLGIGSSSGEIAATEMKFIKVCED